MKCPKCNSPVVPMQSGKGFRCAKPGNRWDNARKRWTLCDGVVWNKSSPASKSTPRPADFPAIAKPTEEQVAVRDVLAMAPAARGARAVAIDAGPGTGKTTTLAWATRWLWQRLGNLLSYLFLAFNRNAKDALSSKLPMQVSDVMTMNSAGGRLQGYKFENYQANKITRLYRDLTDHLPEKERKSLGVVKGIIERMRDLCLFNPDETDRQWWAEAINTTVQRFPSLAKRYAGQEAHAAEWVPVLAVRAHAAKGKIDIQEQITRPVAEAAARAAWRPEFATLLKRADAWTDAEVSHFARLVRAVATLLPDVKGMIIDEAQDLSLAQIALFLAVCYRTGELTLIGDDKAGEPGQEGYKAGQAIYGWRGAMPGSMRLIARLWRELTGETVINRQLTVTHRCRPEIVSAFAPLNTVARSAREAGGVVASVTHDAAFTAWLQAEGSALWITRTNRPLAPVFLATLKAGKDCTIRGGGDFEASLDAALYPAAGSYDDAGEFKTGLDACLAALRHAAAEEAAEGKAPDPNSMEMFFVEVAEELKANADLRRREGIGHLTVGAVRRFLLKYADKQSRRVLTTVYRCKGDEADTVIVADADAFNSAWSGDEDEAAACRHVACSRARDALYTVGYIAGTNIPATVADDIAA